MNILRRASTARLLAGIVVIAVAFAATAYAVSHRTGPTPPRRSLAQAIQHAIKAKPVQGVTARISFTDHLFPSGSLGQSGSSPILTGASGRLWFGGGKLRIELQAQNGDTEIGAGPGGLIVYDVAGGTAYELPAAHHHAASAKMAEHAGHHGVPSLAEIQRAIHRLARKVSLSGAIPGDVAGQPAYTVRISPRHAGGLLGAVQLAWDANHGVPLSIGVYSQGSNNPVLALRVTDISYGRVPASDLAVRLASGTKVVKIKPPAHMHSSAGHQAAVTGVTAVARAVPFRLAAPASLVGVPRREVRLVDWAGTPAALAVYGRGLGGIAVLEQAVPKDAGPLASLPRVSIRGASGHELATALGTVLQFDRGGVRYTVIGSLPAAAAEAAARDIG